MKIDIAGYCGVRVFYKRQHQQLPLVVARGKGPNLLGRNWFKPLGFAISGVNTVSDVSPTLEMVNSFPAVSRPDLGCYTSPPVHLDLLAGKRPKYSPARAVKLPLITKMEEAIDTNVNRGLWVPTNHSVWASGLVPVEKRGGAMRLCADYKGTVNPAINADSYKSPSTDQVLLRLGGGKFFAEIDLAEAYLQIPVDEETSKILTVNTVKGLHRVTRLPFGIEVASAIFQRIMDGLLGGVPGVVVYQDNIYIKSSSLPEHHQRLRDVLQILSDAGFKVNAQKCTWISTEIRVLGFRVSDQGVSPIEDRVSAIKDAPAPESLEQLQSILGLLSFYGRFFQGKAHILEPLHRLLDDGAQWIWGPKHDLAFQMIKDRISSDQVLIHYSLDLPLTLTCDASPYGVGAVISHTLTDESTRRREERPVHFASKTLSKTERNYSQLNKEALAIMYGIRKFSMYLQGRKFLIVTDHKPLLGIFTPGADIPEDLSPRRTRWAVALAAMDYRLQHKPGADIGHADFLSRLPLPADGGDMYPDPVGIHHLEAKVPDDLSPEAIAQETLSDPLLSRVLDWTASGWPESVPEEAAVYAQKRDSLSIQQGCLLYQDRVVIPLSMRSSVLKLIHSTHPGITYSKQIARAIVWWPRVAADVEQAVRQCQQCQAVAHSPKRAEFSPWPPATRPWERVHLDYAGPFLGHYFLVAIDAYSKWPIVKLVPNLSSKTLITTLRYMFADYGKPQVIVSDNGRQFVSEETLEFLRANNIKFMHSPPWHPASNGLAERDVQSFKMLMKKFLRDDIHARLARTLWAMRTSPQHPRA